MNRTWYDAGYVIVDPSRNGIETAHTIRQSAKLAKPVMAR